MRTLFGTDFKIFHVCPTPVQHGLIHAPRNECGLGFATKSKRRAAVDKSSSEAPRHHHHHHWRLLRLVVGGEGTYFSFPNALSFSLSLLCCRRAGGNRSSPGSPQQLINRM
jgi:hypothetical protein